jgi:hypothetical protein
MNEALMLGSLRLHEITAAVSSVDLQIIVALIAHEAKSAAGPCVEGYR